MEGKDLPDVTLYEGNPGGAVKLRELFAGKKGIILGVPGAYTPGCSKTHVPSYVGKSDELKAAGADVVVVMAGNDAFVMDAWAEATGGKAKGFRYLSDFKGEFAKAADVELDAAAVLGGHRMKRFSMVVKDNKVVNMNVEPDGTGLSCSLGDPTIEQLKAVQ